MQREQRQQVVLTIAGSALSPLLLIAGGADRVAGIVSRALPRCIKDELYWWQSAREFRRQMENLP